MIYQFKKIFFPTDNDFVMWQVANNNNWEVGDPKNMVEKIIKDTKLKLTNRYGERTNLNAFVANMHHRTDNGGTSKNIVNTNFFGMDCHLWLHKWKYEHFCNLEKELNPQPKLKI